MKIKCPHCGAATVKTGEIKLRPEGTWRGIRLCVACGHYGVEFWSGDQISRATLDGLKTIYKCEVRDE